MDETELLREFRRVCAIATQIDRDCESVTEFEAQLVRLVDIAHQLTRNVALQCFAEIIRGDLEAPTETVPFCMHALRFPEIPDEMKCLIGDPPNPRLMNYASHVYRAYEDDWQDRDMWHYFGPAK